MAKRLFLIDGSAYVYRSFFAIRGLTNSQGQPTNAAFGFARILVRVLREQNPDAVAIVFDAPGGTFRDELYADYKANRPEMPEELVSQLPWIDEIVGAFNIPNVRIEGVEADDVMGTLAQRAAAEGYDVVLVSGDKDILQLVQDGIQVFDPYRGDGTWYDAEGVRERYGVPPEQMIDVFALMGDSSDNVPGVRGIGEKTAVKLIQQYGTLEGLYERIGELKGKQKERLEQDKELAFLSRELVTIKTDVAIDAKAEDFARRDYDTGKLLEVFSRLEFNQLVQDLIPNAATGDSTDYQPVLDSAKLDAVIAEMRAAGTFAVDTETTSVDPMQAELVGISMSCRAGTGYYIPVGHARDAMVLNGEPVSGLTREAALDQLRPLLEDPRIGKAGHNIKYDLIVFRQAGLELKGIEMDTMVASYLTDPSRLRHNLDDVSLHYLKRKLIPISELIGKGAKAITFDRVPLEPACTYASEDADITWRLVDVFRGTLRERGLEALFHDVERPLIGVLARMEMAGIAIDRALFAQLQRELDERLGELAAEIHADAGVEFQINSPKQLQEVLFGKLGLTPLRKTKTGHSTDVDVLEQLAHEHPLPAKILEYRTLDKLRGTYVDALPKLVHPATGRIHTSFNQAVAATGRLSSSDPNLQNIPVRTDIGRRIRKGFVPGRPDHQLISADYSQIELRILAHLSGDAGLIDAFNNDLDIHRDTAARIFGVFPETVTPEMRRQAKAVNFGVVYGISPFGLSRSLGISNPEAARFIDQYFEQYPGVKQWTASTIQQAKERGYVTTLLNRRRYVPELAGGTPASRRAAERAATNTPVQGSAADIIKLAMIQLDDRLAPTGAQLLLQVHDELVVECPSAQVDEVAQIMRRTMEAAFELAVPLKVDVGIGANWAEIH